ncbi:SAM-dependent methyltransferase, partial [Escherichia coli]
AVDLGAAPGGWTWQLVNREMRVTAVDNGPMAENLMYSGLVDHQKVDGYQY